jgi:hypothetical protein
MTCSTIECIPFMFSKLMLSSTWKMFFFSIFTRWILASGSFILGFFYIVVYWVMTILLDLFKLSVNTVTIVRKKISDNMREKMITYIAADFDKEKWPWRTKRTHIYIASVRINGTPCFLFFYNQRKLTWRFLILFSRFILFYKCILLAWYLVDRFVLWSIMSYWVKCLDRWLWRLKQRIRGFYLFQRDSVKPSRLF